MVVMVRRFSRFVRVLTSAALLIAFPVVSCARCLADTAESAARMACCAELDQDCGHASVQQGCCAVDTPDNGSLAISSRIDHVKPHVIAALTVNVVWQAPVAVQSALDIDAGPTRLSRPTYLLIAAFRI